MANRESNQTSATTPIQPAMTAAFACAPLIPPRPAVTKTYGHNIVCCEHKQNTKRNKQTNKQKQTNIQAVLRHNRLLMLFLESIIYVIHAWGLHYISRTYFSWDCGNSKNSHVTISPAIQASFKTSKIKNNKKWELLLINTGNQLKSKVPFLLNHSLLSAFLQHLEQQSVNKRKVKCWRF